MNETEPGAGEPTVSGIMQGVSCAQTDLIAFDDFAGLPRPRRQSSSPRFVLLSRSFTVAQAVAMGIRWWMKLGECV